MNSGELRVGGRKRMIDYNETHCLRPLILTSHLSPLNYFFGA